MASYIYHPNKTARTLFNLRADQYAAHGMAAAVIEALGADRYMKLVDTRSLPATQGDVSIKVDACRVRIGTVVQL